MTSRSELAEDFLNKLGSLIGKPCWSFCGGENTGSDIDLGFGRKIPRIVRLLNPYLTEEQKYYDAEIVLFIKCAWRLDSGDAVICGSTDSNIVGGPMLTGLRSIVWMAVESVKIERPAFDLTVRFKGDLMLRISCDQTNVEDDYDNYSLHLTDKVYVVGARGRISCEARG